MLLKLLTENPDITKECQLYHDINGNIIAQLTSKIDEKIKYRYYRLDIDKYDKLVFTKIKDMCGMYSLVDGKISYTKIQNILDNTLK
jgi:hypothetical protein